jgi:hypothetical protein
VVLKAVQAGNGKFEAEVEQSPALRPSKVFAEGMPEKLGLAGIIVFGQRLPCSFLLVLCVSGPVETSAQRIDRGR